MTVRARLGGGPFGQLEDRRFFTRLVSSSSFFSSRTPSSIMRSLSHAGEGANGLFSCAGRGWSGFSGLRNLESLPITGPTSTSGSAYAVFFGGMGDVRRDSSLSVVGKDERRGGRSGIAGRNRLTLQLISFTTSRK